jgi:hypothetical protein
MPAWLVLMQGLASAACVSALFVIVLILGWGGGVWSYRVGVGGVVGLGGVGGVGGGEGRMVGGDWGKEGGGGGWGVGGRKFSSFSDSLQTGCPPWTPCSTNCRQVA